MNINVVENVKQVECDVLIINKFEDKQTTCDLVNQFLPSEFSGKKGETFVFPFLCYLLNSRKRILVSTRFVFKAKSPFIIHE